MYTPVTEPFHNDLSCYDYVNDLHFFATKFTGKLLREFNWREIFELLKVGFLAGGGGRGGWITELYTKKPNCEP